MWRKDVRDIDGMRRRDVRDVDVNVEDERRPAATWNICKLCRFVIREIFLRSVRGTTTY